MKYKAIHGIFAKINLFNQQANEGSNISRGYGHQNFGGITFKTQAND